MDSTTSMATRLITIKDTTNTRRMESTILMEIAITLMVPAMEAAIILGIEAMVTKSITPMTRRWQASNMPTIMEVMAANMVYMITTAIPRANRMPTMATTSTAS